jgi:hypothetical protein
MSGRIARWPQLDDLLAGRSEFISDRRRESFLVFLRVLNAVLLPLPFIALLLQRIPLRPDMVWSTMLFTMLTWLGVRTHRAFQRKRIFKYRTLKMFGFLLGLALFVSLSQNFG